jgi:hypothetical protein
MTGFAGTFFPVVKFAKLMSTIVAASEFRALDSYRILLLCHPEKLAFLRRG